MIKVCKFGGTSLANSENIEKCREIVVGDRARRFIVVSAPGKDGASSRKITDLLNECYLNRFDDELFEKTFGIIEKRYKALSILSRNVDIDRELSVIKAQIRFFDVNIDYVLSRGEYLNARIIADYFGFQFLDATEFIRFRNGLLDIKATLKAAENIDRTANYVIPGFYGMDEDNHIKTFSRGGSDIAGAVVARVFQADIYENWTDVDGIYICDPKVVPEGKKVRQVSFRELREMSYMGASVLHADTLFPIFDNPIPIVIKNTFSPESEGTYILKKRNAENDSQAITCITGKNDYSCIQISKMMLDKEIGYVKKVTSVFEEYGISISHTHSGLDTICFFVENSEYKRISLNDFLTVLEERINADRIKSIEKLALVAVIGHNLSGKVGLVAKIFNALAAKAISVRTVYQSISECNIIIGVDDSRFTQAIRAIYYEIV